MTEIAHDSDCAQHNEPAYPNGPCDCSASHSPMTNAPTPAGMPGLVDWFSQFIDQYVETNGPDSDALIACLDRVRDSYRLAAQPSAGAEPVAWDWRYVEFDGAKTEHLTRYDPRDSSKHDQSWVTDVQPLYTHPGPVQAKKGCCDRHTIGSWCDDCKAAPVLTALEGVTEEHAEKLCEAFWDADPRDDGEGKAWPYTTLSERRQWAYVAKAALEMFAAPVQPDSGGVVGTVEAVARAIDPDSWAHIDACHAAMETCADEQLVHFRKVVEKRLTDSGSIPAAERVLAALAPVAAEGEVEPEAFDRMMALLENPPLASEELKARLRDARRLITPTPPAAQSEGGAGHE